MESENLFAHLSHLGSSGVVLSVEQRSSLQSSLVLLRGEHKFSRVKLWGVIHGIKSSYFIAMGVGRDEIDDRKALYSQDCTEWLQLPHVDDGMKERSSRLQGRFTGDPSYVYEHTYTHRVGEGEGAQEKVTKIEMKEVDRLAAVVARIDEDTAVVPRGAYIQTPLGEVVLNKSFQGLPLADAKRLKYYLHFKHPASGQEKSISQAVDFLEPVEKDIPNGCWSLLCDQGGACVVLRSLVWMGLVAYHVPSSTNYGYFYCGTGEKNPDLLFML